MSIQQELFLLPLDYVKNHLDIHHKADDILLYEFIEGAQKRFEGYVNRPIYGTTEEVEHFHGGTRLITTYFPFDPSRVTVEDVVRENTLSDDEVHVEIETGFIFRTGENTRKQTRFEKGINRWKVSYYPGLEFHPRWDDYMREHIATSLRDLIADWYENRAPILGEERFGGGSVISYRNLPLSHRVKAVWDEIGRDLF